MATEPPYYQAERQRWPTPGKGQPMKMGQSVLLIPRRREGIRKLLKAEVCEMQTTDVLLGLLRERGKRGLPLTRIYRQLFNPHLYLTAYGRIYRNKGAMTPGVTEETADSMSLEKINTIIQAVRQERYQWHPARRTYILKKNGKKRPLGMPVWSDKLLAEVMRMILDAYFDGTFSDHSHGFRSERGCHTALQDIYHSWKGTVWLIEGDIADCFGSLDHGLILSTLGEHIQDGRFLGLVQKLLDAGYLEERYRPAVCAKKGRGRLLANTDNRRNTFLLSKPTTQTTDGYAIAGTPTILRWHSSDQRKRQKRSSSNSEHSCLKNSSSICRRKRPWLPMQGVKRPNSWDTRLPPCKATASNIAIKTGGKTAGSMETSACVCHQPSCKRNASDTCERTDPCIEQSCSTRVTTPSLQRISLNIGGSSTTTGWLTTFTRFTNSNG